jgi:oxygen-independent coproporphyrinogen-3 oxidase
VVSLETFSAHAISATTVPSVRVPGLYVHVPFCFHKCHYCDFYSITRQTPERMTRFVDLILQEADQWNCELSNTPRVEPETIFFGGGTPSLLPLDQMQRLIRGLKKRFDFRRLSEWTVEINPATANLQFCQMLRAEGVDRLSFGAQSFTKSELATLERHHDPDDVPRSLEIAREAGFSRLNVDLIYAIPNQTMADWSHSLESAIALGTPHVSCYALTYESNTPMAVRKRLGHFQAASDDLEIQMMLHTRRRLAESNQPAYEISNYATAGEECRHNLLYWNGGSYIGLGPSAASHVEGTRWKNRAHLGEWENSIAAGTLPARDAEILTPAQRAGELAMLLLRLSRGLIYADFTARTGFDARTIYADQIDQLSRTGFLHVSNEGFHLTEAGLPVADSIASKFLNPEP